jgi:predicted acyltransferase (DUF342 family)
MKLNLNTMFGNKSKEPSYTEEVKTPVRTSAPQQEKVLTLISDGCKFEGNLSSPSTTKIDGHIVGNLRGESGIIIGEKGIVEGNINAVDITISGTVKGNIKAHRLSLEEPVLWKVIFRLKNWLLNQVRNSMVHQRWVKQLPRVT